jgi:hypothetical protein
MKLSRSLAIFLIFLVLIFLLVYLLAHYFPVAGIWTRLIGTVLPIREHYLTYSLLGGYAQSMKCTQGSKGILTEPKAIFINDDAELVGNATLRVYLLITCGDTLDRKWRIKVNDFTIIESSNCFSDWDYVDLSFPSNYLHSQYNSVTLECEPTTSGSFYINLGKASDGITEFFRTTYYVKS